MTSGYVVTGVMIQSSHANRRLKAEEDGRLDETFRRNRANLMPGVPSSNPTSMITAPKLG